MQHFDWIRGRRKRAGAAGRNRSVPRAAHRNGLSRLWIALAWLALLGPGGAAADRGVPISDMPRIDIGRLEHRQLLAPVEFLSAGRDSDLAEVRQSRDFAPLDPSQIGRGITAEVYWLRVRLSNADSATDRRWILHHDTSYLDHMTVYYADREGAFSERRLSDRLPFEQRDVDFRKLAFSHTTPAHGYTDLYLRLGYDKPDALTLRLHLWDENTFHQARAQTSLLYGGYYGMMLAILCIALICALVLRRAVYMEYAVFLLFNGLLWMALNGFGFQYLWPNLPAVQNEGIHIIFLSMALAAFQFSKGLLNTRLLFPRLHRCISFIQIGMLGAMGLRFAGFYLPVLLLAYAAMVSLSLLPVLGWRAYRKGVRHARWYTVAWSIYAASILCSVASAAGVLPGWGRESLAYTQLAGLLEALLLLVALGDRLMGWDRERRTALALALRDPLTGLGNRRRLIQAFGEQDMRAGPMGEPAFVAMIDLDRFKEINDTYGHDAGDLVLQHLARLLLRHTRADDVCVRYGGEEFAVLFRAPSLADAHQVVERIRLEFAASPTRYAEHDIEHTFSAGLVQVDNLENGLGLEEMVARADAALYDAKAGGRNRTLLSGGA